MKDDGTYPKCDDTVDSTGYYVYRKDGKRDGECWGMDFEKARRDYNGQGKCVTGSKLCEKSLISTCVCVLNFNTTRTSFYAYMHPLRYMPFVRDAIFTLASGLHEVLEVNNPGNNKVDGSHLHGVIKRNGFADGITGKINFTSEGVDRDFQHMNYIVFNAQNGAFARVGTILEDTPEFKDCAQYKKAYGTTLSRECKDMIFRGLY